MNNRTTTDLDKVIGHQLYTARVEAGMTREDLASRIGITHQQIHKYECGKNRIAVSRLHRIAEECGKPFMWFLMEEENSPEVDKQTAGLIRNFNRLDKRTKHAAHELIKTLSKGE